MIEIIDVTVLAVLAIFDHRVVQPDRAWDTVFTVVTVVSLLKGYINKY